MVLVLLLTSLILCTCKQALLAVGYIVDMLKIEFVERNTKAQTKRLPGQPRYVG